MSEIHECRNCYRTGEITIHGSCNCCGSLAVLSIHAIGESLHDERVAQDFQKRLQHKGKTGDLGPHSRAALQEASA